MKEEKSPILIISDVHLGSEFSHARELMAFLERESFGKLILNGDILDNPNLKFFTPEHWRFIELLQRFRQEGREIVWILGNHDTFARHFFKSLGIKTKNQYSFEWNGKRCLALHGHQYDKFLIQNRVMATTMNRSYRIIQRMDRTKRRVTRFIKMRYKVWLRVSSRVAKGAIKYARAKKFDYVFCGHTHEKLAMKMGHVHYLNSGSWADKPCHYIILKDGRAKIGTVEV